MIKKYSLIDIWRVTHPNDKQFTWRNIHLKRASRLDFWLITKTTKGKILTTDIRPAIRADHNAISLKLHTMKNKRGPGYWKLNSNILKDEVYQNKIIDIIHSFSENDLPTQLKWEFFKIKVREFTQKYTREKALKRKNDKLLLEERFTALEKQINVNIHDVQLQKTKLEVQDKLEKIYKYEAKGAGIRARVRWMEEGEKSTKYFLGLEKSNAKKKEITQLKCENDNKVIDSNENILNEIVNYYSKLYKGETHNKDTINDMSDYVTSKKINRLSNESKQLCEGLITHDECKRAIFAMQKNKAPGSDGISIEFYQMFWPHLKDFLVESLNECYITGMMTDSQRKGLITLLFKKGDCRYLKNWRPITLLNNDYKIIAAVLAARVHKVINEIIHENQSGYVKGRLAACNVRLTKDVIEYFKKHCKLGAIMLADFTKAFDTLDIKFLNLCLEKFNFGESFRKWILVLYSDISSSVLVNGWISNCFKVERGIRQGCPLSALLFIIAAEFLASSVRENKNVKCIKVIDCDFQLKLLQYADDTLFFVEDEDSLREILKELNLFGRIAGPKINKEKTALFWLGDTSKRYSVTCYDLLWANKPVKYLGNYIYSDNEEALNLEWEQKIVKLKKTLNSWSKRNLTLFGRITILKSLALSQIIHLSIVDTIPTKVLKILNNIVFKFIWNKNVEKIKRNTLTKDYKNGGMRMIDIQKQMFSFRLKWLGRLLNYAEENNETWKRMSFYWFDLLGGIKLMLNCNYSMCTLQIVKEKNIPTFYNEILQAWELIRIYNSTGKYMDILNYTDNDVQNQIIWHNKYVLFDNHSLFYKDWYENDIVFFNDIGKNLVDHKTLKSVENVYSCFKTPKSKGNILFEYVKLKKAIPKMWINKKCNEEEIPIQNKTLLLPTLTVNGKTKNISELNSKTFYRLILSKMNSLSSTNSCCLFWEHKLGVDVDWQTVFKSNLVDIKENKLREFNVKILYNLLPVRRNLYKWGVTKDGFCLHCNVEEDIVHAFITCEMNTAFLNHVKYVIEYTFDTDIKIDAMSLLNTDHYEHSLVVRIAFWCIYKQILERNKTGKDKRSVNLRYVFAREISSRVEINELMRKGNDKRLPRKLLYYV